MNLLADYLRGLWRDAWAGWNRFWFTPSDPSTLCLVRILAGLMLLYTHAVWTFELEAFFGRQPWLSTAAVESFQRGLSGEEEIVVPGAGVQGRPRPSYAWSYLKHVASPAVLWTLHLAALCVFALLTLGLFSRAASVLAFLITVAYVNRVPGALFGLDQINAMLAMYLAVGPCGAKYSLDRWLRQSRAGGRDTAAPSVSANVAVRLMQLHMCVIYFFAGIGKLQGESWWSGLALWLAFANQEYQTLDMTWLARWPLVVNFLTHVTVYWEIFFCALVWPRRLRPLVLLVAIPLHLGIGLCLGMMTFGLVMLIGCLSFVPPEITAAALTRLRALAPRGRAGEGAPAAGPARKPQLRAAGAKAKG